MNAGGHLYHNNGNGTFTDMTSLLPSATPAVNAHGLVPLFFDYNGDRLADLYLGNDIGGEFGPNVLWKNNGSNGMGGWNAFADVSSATKAGIAMSNMGIAIGDYNRDGFYDLYLTNNGNNKLLRGSSTGTFTEVGGSANVSHPTNPATNGTTTNVGWGTAFIDLNNDGWEDLVFGSGSMAAKVALPNVLYLNNQDGTFLDLGKPAGIEAPGMSARLLVVSDFNGDGFPDIFVTEMGEFPHLFINNGCSLGNTNYYLRVKLVGTTSNRDSVGARLVATVGGAQLVRTIHNGGTFQSNDELIAHFGLGSAN